MNAWKITTGACVAALIVTGGYVANVFPGEIAPIDQIDAEALTDDLVNQGANLAMIGDCAACHTAKGNHDTSGGLALQTPFGTIYSTNITPDRDTGIGTWSLAAFDRAMRDGIDRQGKHLYPAFPYDHFATITDADMQALYAYLMSQDPVSAQAQANELIFPLNVRPLLAGWKLLFHNPRPFQPDLALSEDQNRGKYLAETLGHCSACHSPRNVFGAVKQVAYLQGGEAEGWLAPPLGGASISPIIWTEDDYVDYLFDGLSNHHSIAAGPMTSVVDHLYEANEDDVFAIATWLASITPTADEATLSSQVAAVRARDLPDGFDFALTGLQATPQVLAGADVFKVNCFKCHKERIADTQPVSLGQTFAVNAPTPANLFNVVLGGIEPPLGSSAHRMQAVPLSAADLADVAAFVRWRFSVRPAWEGLAANAKTSFSQHTAP